MANALLERPSVRHAVQVSIAASLSIAAGRLISGERWYWALIAAFIIGIGAGSRSEVVVKGLQRLVGTAGGVLIGMVLATVLSGHAMLSAGLALLFLFLAFYAAQAAYGTMIFFITLTLALLYGLLGQFRPELLVLRLEETGVGAAIGVLATTLVLPVRQRKAFLDSMDAFLTALANSIDAAGQTATGGSREDDSRSAMEKLQSAMQDLRNAVGALKRGWLPLTEQRYLFAIRAARRCSYLTREATEHGGLAPEAREALSTRARALRSDCDKELKGAAEGISEIQSAPLAAALDHAISQLRHRLEAIG